MSYNLKFDTGNCSTIIQSYHTWEKYTILRVWVRICYPYLFVSCPLIIKQISIYELKLVKASHRGSLGVPNRIKITFKCSMFI